jgi:hypothetical protein
VKERIARAPEYARLLLVRFRKPLEKRRLSDASLAAYEHKATIACGYITKYSL